jgi:ketosteroid isomerase-like protein
LTCALLVPFIAACGTDEPDDADIMPAAEESAVDAADTDLPAELTSANEAYAAAWNGEDADAVAAHFTEDAVVVEGDSTYTGRAEIRDRWIGINLPAINSLSMSNETFDWVGEDVLASGDYTLMVTMPDATEPTEMGGTYSDTWTRGADGTWMISNTEIRPDADPAM